MVNEFIFQRFLYGIVYELAFLQNYEFIIKEGKYNTLRIIIRKRPEGLLERMRLYFFRDDVDIEVSISIIEQAPKHVCRCILEGIKERFKYAPTRRVTELIK